MLGLSGLRASLYFLSIHTILEGLNSVLISVFHRVSRRYELEIAMTVVHHVAVPGNLFPVEVSLPGAWSSNRLETWFVCPGWHAQRCPIGSPNGPGCAPDPCRDYGPVSIRRLPVSENFRHCPCGRHFHFGPSIRYLIAHWLHASDRLLGSILDLNSASCFRNGCTNCCRGRPFQCFPDHLACDPPWPGDC